MDLTGLDPELASRCELTLVSPVLTTEQVTKICAGAQSIGAYGLCLPSSRVAQAYEILGDTSLKVTCLVGFPFGSNDSDVKRYETEVAVDSGAHEIELYLNHAMIKDGQHKLVLRELRDVAEASDERRVKVCFDLSQLTAEEVQTACQLTMDSGAHFVSLYQAGIGDEIVAAVRLMVGKQFGIKVSGFRNFVSAPGLLEAGANRLGYLELQR